MSIVCWPYRNRNFSPNIVFPKPSECDVAVLFALGIYDGGQHFRLSIRALPILDGAHYFMETAWPLQTHRAESRIAKRQRGTSRTVTKKYVIDPPAAARLRFAKVYPFSMASCLTFAVDIPS
jgi:hypothetical protein